MGILFPFCSAKILEAVEPVQVKDPKAIIILQIPSQNHHNIHLKSPEVNESNHELFLPPGISFYFLAKAIWGKGLGSSV